MYKFQNVSIMEKKSNGMAVASLVTGIVSIVLCWVPIVGLVCGILGIIFYVKAKKAIDANIALASSKGMATGGLVTGIVGLVFSLFYTVFWIFFVLLVESASHYTSHGYSNF